MESVEEDHDTITEEESIIQNALNKFEQRWKSQIIAVVKVERNTL